MQGVHLVFLEKDFLILPEMNSEWINKFAKIKLKIFAKKESFSSLLNFSDDFFFLIQVIIEKNQRNFVRHERDSNRRKL